MGVYITVKIINLDEIQIIVPIYFLTICVCVSVSFTLASFVLLFLNGFANVSNEN